MARINGFVFQAKFGVLVVFEEGNVMLEVGDRDGRMVLHTFNGKKWWRLDEVGGGGWNEMS